MGRARATGVQGPTNGQYYVQIPPASGQKVYLGKDKRRAERWALALEEVEDHDEARQRIKTLRSTRKQGDTAERLTLAGMLAVPETIPFESEHESRLQLTYIMASIEKKVTGEMLDLWCRAVTSEDHDALLKNWDFPERDIWMLYKGQKLRRKPNPEYLKRHPEARAKVFRDYAEQEGIPLDMLLARKDEPAPSKKTIKACFPEWARLKSLQRKPIGQKQVDEINRIMRQFRKCIGDKPINLLEKADFLKWEEHVLKNQKKGRMKDGKQTAYSEIWFNRRMGAVHNVFEFLIMKTDWPFPDSLPLWLKTEQQTYASNAHNRERMPVHVFDRLLQQTGEWATIDVDAHAEELYRNAPLNAPDRTLRARCKREATQRKRQGLLYSAILRLACNGGYDPTCISKIRPENIRDLDGKLPYIELGRTKMSRKTGAEIIRKTPLLPSTVTALKAWMEFDGEGETLFCSDRGQQLRSDVISTGVKNLSDEICKIEAQRKGGVSVEGWTLKHLRNVGSSLGKINKRPMDERQAFLGHLANGTNVFYEDPDLGPGYLLDLVNLIGNEYFDGEQVGKTR